MRDSTAPSAEGAANTRFPTLDHVWLAAALSIVVVRALAWPIIPSDFWWQLAYGRWIVENGTIPVVDHFSYLRSGQPYFDQPWLAQVLMFWIYRVGGAALSLVALATLLFATYALLLRLLVRTSGSVRFSAALVILSLPVAMTNWSVRSQMFALPLFALYLVVLESWRTGREGERSGHRLWVLPVAMVAWVNLHGSFVLGGILIALYFLGELGERRLARSRRSAADPGAGGRRGGERPLGQLLLWGGLAALAVFLNPAGPGVFRYVIGLVGNPAIQGIVEEWQAPTIGTVVGRLFFAWATLVGLAAILRRRWPDLVDICVLVAFFWLALGGERHVMWFALASLPFLARQIGAIFPAEAGAPVRQGRRALNLTFLGLMAFAVVLVLPPIKPHLSLPPEVRPLVSPDTPVASVAFLQSEPRRPGRLFHTEATGSYLMWAAPEQGVFVDARV
ncbi:MAG: hypothetical protein M8866_03010, partial [marine benthic group bacterium]|nr:hypothetical protein [Candidatus Benthicola marisminoris]